MKREYNTELVLELFEKFSRFEYALKQVGFLRKGQYAQPSWRKFSLELDKTPIPREDRSKFAFLLENPPRIQIREKGNKLGWSAQPNDEDRVYTYAFLIEMVGRVRNNLFHGGKHSRGHMIGSEKDEKLLRVSIDLLDFAATKNKQVLSYYENLE